MNNASSISRIRKILLEPIVLLPCVGKRPLDKDWPKLSVACMTPRHLARLNKWNIGLATGEPSAGCCALDIDSNEGVEAFLAIHPPAEAWPRLDGAHGAKLFVRIEGDYPGKSKLKVQGKNWGDWLSTGAQAVVHGVHPDTHQPYKWTVENQVQTISFGVIRDALCSLNVQLGRSNPKQLSPTINPQPPNNSSKSCNLNPESCVLNAASCILHNKEDAERIVARIKARNKLRSCVAEKFSELGKLFDNYVEERFEAAAGNRNGSLVAAIPFLIRCVSPTVALELVMMFYHSHEHLFNDPPEQHRVEAVAMIKGVESSYLDELAEAERSVFNELDEHCRSAFRICRDLAYRPDSQTPLVFFMACNELAARLQIYDMQASRLLRWFEALKIIAMVEKGERRQQGKLPKASSYRWLLGTPPVNTQTEGGQTI